LYLAQKNINGQNHYFIRESYPRGACVLSRDLVDLGPDPGRYILYPGGNSFYIDDTIENSLIDRGRQPDPDQLEDIFWRFVHPEIRRVLEAFRSREKRHQANRRKSRPQKIAQAGIHIFDKRRIHFLRFGQMDQRNLARLPQKMFYGVSGKSRDEIEQMFMEMESELAVREYKSYAYVIFDLQHHFHESFARRNPQMLSQEKVDENFIEQVCRLNSDAKFWAGMPSGNNLGEYLIRYVLMYFDHDYAPASFVDEYLRQFINSRRQYRPPQKNRTVILKEASTVFGRTEEVLKNMTRKELSSLYRQKAQELHPDKGGEHDRFVELTEAYNELVRLKK
jgi:hypothetical protein